MRWKEFAAGVLAGVGAPAWYRRRNRGRLAILMYHGLVEQTLEPACWHQLGIAEFRKQMEWIARSYRVLPLGTALERMAEGTLREATCAITFDDGYASVGHRAFPVLRSLGLSSTVFLATAVVGTSDVLWPDRLYLAVAGTAADGIDLRRLGGERVSLEGDEARSRAYAQAVNLLKSFPAAEKDARLAEILRDLDQEGLPEPGPFRALDWKEVESLSESGLVEFGAHSLHHDILARLPDAAVEEEVGASHREVSARLGRVPSVFAYPNGRTCDFDERAKRAVTNLGVRWALSTVEGLCDPATDPLALRRLGIGADTSYAKFRLQVSGVLEARARTAALPSDEAA